MSKLLGFLFAIALSSHAWADETSLRKAVEAAYPKVKVDSVTKTSYTGIYEVYLGGQIIYTDEKFNFLIAEGRLVDTKTKRDVTGDRLDELNKVDFSSLPLDQAIKVVRGNGSRKLVVFSDPDCPFCKRLEQKELINMTDITIYTFLFPIEQLHPDASNKSKAIWCSSDKAKAWQEWALNGQLPKPAANCDAPLDKIAELGRKLGVNSTPTLIFADGKRMLGAQPADAIEKMLGAPSAKK